MFAIFFKPDKLYSLAQPAGNEPTIYDRLKDFAASNKRPAGGGGLAASSQKKPKVEPSKTLQDFAFKAIAHRVGDADGGGENYTSYSI